MTDVLGGGFEESGARKIVNGQVTYAVEEDVVVVTVDSPPVNALGAAVRQGIQAAIERAEGDSAVAGIVLICAGRTFFAGADIKEFGKPPVAPSLRDIQQTLEGARKPIVAAIHGTALGGGLELALVAHFRVALASAKFGLPEVKLGILPGAGGTQRLPRMIGVERALEMIATGVSIGAAEALEIGLIDAVVAQDLRGQAIAFARSKAAERRPFLLVRNRHSRLIEAKQDPDIFARFRKANARKFRGFKAPEAIIAAIEASVSLPFEEGLVRERALFDELMADSQAAAQRHLFFAERQASKIEGLPANTATLPIVKVGVIGAGTMGGGIAMNFLNAGIPVTIVETTQAALDRGLGVIRKNYDASAAKGKLSTQDVTTRMALLTSSLTVDDLADADLIIEAVFEDLAVKRDVFARLDKAAKPGAILATNTSYLDIDDIAAATERPASVVGLHFFSPANVMQLLEIVRTRDTSLPIVATVAKLAPKIGKIGVTVGNGFGFVGNRILAARNREADKLILEGATPADVDRVLFDFGFPMGHFQMRDLVGLDVGWNRATSNSGTVREILNEMGRHGQKSGGGYYDYDDQRRHSQSPIVACVIADFAATKGIDKRSIDDVEIHDRLLFAMVNEGARILDEGIAQRASDIDIVWVTGYGWPRYRGGPMYWADQLGLPQVLEKLRGLQVAHGPDFTPSQLLERYVAEGRNFNA